MFTRILQWWQRRAREKSRAIFRFWDGEKERTIDPMVVWQRLLADPEFDMDTDSKLAAAEDNTIALDAMARGARAVERAFGVRRFDDGGLTYEEAWDLLADYWEWLERVKKNTNSPPISPPLMESAFSETNPAGMNASSVSGAMPTAPISAGRVA